MKEMVATVYNGRGNAGEGRLEYFAFLLWQKYFNSFPFTVL